jgi:hypothetical protein
MSSKGQDARSTTPSVRVSAIKRLGYDSFRLPKAVTRRTLAVKAGPPARAPRAPDGADLNGAVPLSSPAGAGPSGLASREQGLSGIGPAVSPGTRGQAREVNAAYSLGVIRIVHDSPSVLISTS